MISRRNLLVGIGGGALLAALPATVKALSPPIFYPEDFGALANGVHDDGPAIQAAIDAAILARGRVVTEAKTYGTKQGLVVYDDDCEIVGNGGAWPDTLGVMTGEGTIIKALPGFPASQKVFLLQPRYTGPGTARRLRGVSARNIAIDCANIADNGFGFVSIVGSKFENLVVINHKFCGMAWSVLPRPYMIGSEPSSQQYNEWNNLLADGIASDAPYGFLVTGDNDGNTCINHFGRLSYWHLNGDGLQIRSADTNVFDMTTGYRAPGGAGVGIRLLGGSGVADYPRNNEFTYTQAGPGGMRYQAGSAHNPTHNPVLDWDPGNGGPAGPVFDAGCS